MQVEIGKTIVYKDNEFFKVVGETGCYYTLMSLCKDTIDVDLSTPVGRIHDFGSYTKFSLQTCGEAFKVKKNTVHLKYAQDDQAEDYILNYHLTYNYQWIHDDDMEDFLRIKEIHLHIKRIELLTYFISPTVIEYIDVIKAKIKQVDVSNVKHLFLIFKKYNRCCYNKFAYDFNTIFQKEIVDYDYDI